MRLVCVAYACILWLRSASMGLAPILVREVFEIIHRIRSEQELTLLLVEQNAVAALRLADRAYLIETGKIVLEGPADDLKEDPRIQKAYLVGGREEAECTGLGM